MARPKKEVVLITGTSRGIGRFLASHFAKRGDGVIGCSRGQVKLDARNYQHFALDVTDELAVRKMVRDIRQTHGRLDILINNAGAASMNHTLLMPTDTARRLLETNTLGTFIVCREAARLMQRNHYGRIVNMSTVAVPMKIEGEAVYAASKNAIVSFTQILAGELASFNITCNVVGPAPIETDLIRNIPKEKIERLISRLPIKRMGRFEDVANVVDFFVKRASDYVTGQTIYLGGA